MSSTIETKFIRIVLKREKQRLRERREKDFEENRARSSAASEDALSRVLMLEELLDGKAGSTGGDGELDL